MNSLDGAILNQFSEEKERYAEIVEHRKNKFNELLRDYDKLKLQEK